MNYFAVLMNFLRERQQFIHEIEEGIKVDQKNLSLLISSSVFFAIYGAIIGSFGGWLQMFVSAIKLPALYLLTMIICLPTLYFFDVIAGSKRTFGQYLALLLSSMAIISVLLFGFAPITLFFRLSINDYHFFILLNVVILAITGLIGINFFYKTMIMKLIKEQLLDNKQRFLVIKSWLCLYGFVGSQLGWTLRPFFGHSNQTFALFRPIESNFYIEVLKIIGSLLGIH
jgi:hypothetical protein